MNKLRYLLVFCVTIFTNPCNFRAEDHPVVETAGQVSLKEPVGKTLHLLDAMRKAGTSVVQVNDRTAVITSGTLRILFRLIDGNATLSIGEEREKYWSPYPALKGYPLKLTIIPGKETIEENVIYEFRGLSADKKTE